MQGEHRTTDALILEKLSGLERLTNEKFKNIENLLETSTKEHTDFDRRINLIELWQANTVGKITIVSIIIGIIMTSLATWLTKHFG